MKYATGAIQDDYDVGMAELDQRAHEKARTARRKQKEHKEKSDTLRAITGTKRAKTDLYITDDDDIVDLTRVKNLKDVE